MKLFSIPFMMCLLFALGAWTPNAGAQTTSKDHGVSGVSTYYDSGKEESAVVKFANLQGKLKSFAVIILIIMVVVAGIAAAMGKTNMAISTAIGGIILFGGSYIIGLIASGLG